jgi:hypothetical protein
VSSSGHLSRQVRYFGMGQKILLARSGQFKSSPYNRGGGSHLCEQIVGPRYFATDGASGFELG